LVSNFTGEGRAQDNVLFSHNFKMLGHNRYRYAGLFALDLWDVVSLQAARCVQCYKSSKNFTKRNFVISHLKRIMKKILGSI